MCRALIYGGWKVPRISGIDLPADKPIEIALTYIYGLGHTSSKKILAKTGVNPRIRAKDLNDEDTGKIRAEIEQNYKIKRLMDIGTYRGLRHRRRLPVRGQRTHTNARTWKGPKRGSAMRKKK
jgi:small subunit ribosomal protein S13